VAQTDGSVSAQEQAKVKVLYIGGYSRSGSTLVDRMLGQIPGVTSTGELAYIWRRAVYENRLCGCGVRFRDCSFWNDVAEEAFGGWRNVDVDEMMALYHGVNRHRFLPLLVTPSVAPGYRRRLRDYAEILETLYRAIQTVDGSRLIVDSTTDPSYAFLLRHVGAIDLRVVHLVRDSRGTAFSWTRRVVRSDSPETTVYMKRFHPATTAFRWSVYHSLFHLLAALGVPQLFLRYESVVKTPRQALEKMMDFVGEPLDADADLAFVRDGVVDLGPHHTAAGNRVRLKQGEIALRVDDEWRHAMDDGHRRLVTLLSWPLLLRYGYVGARASSL
jgi:hypothetical protein